MSKAVKKVASFALPVVGSAIAGPIGAAVGGAASGAIGGGGLKGIGLGAIKGYAGNVIGNSIGSSLSKGVGASSIGSLTSKNTMGPYSFGNLGSSAANAAGGAIANTTLGNAAGMYAGNALAGNLADSLLPAEEPGMDKPTPFSPTRQAQMETPGALSGFSSLTSDQASTNLATQGVYGGGLGGEEQGYFTNLINRKLIDDAGSVDEDFRDVTPIEQSYLSQIGLGGYGNPKSLLEAISKWKAQ